MDERSRPTDDPHRYRQTDMRDDGIVGTIWMRDTHTGRSVSVHYSAMSAEPPRSPHEAREIAIERLREGAVHA